MKHYFFLDAGDFILHFLSLCGSELVKNVDDVMPSRLESLLELALRTSTANADPFKDDLGLELLSFDLTSQMVRILNFQTGDGRGTRQRLTLWFFFGVILYPPKIKFLNDLICLAINFMFDVTSYPYYLSLYFILWSILGNSGFQNRMMKTVTILISINFSMEIYNWSNS